MIYNNTAIENTNIVNLIHTTNIPFVVKFWFFSEFTLNFIKIIIFIVKRRY
jgi:hypothetical protein